MSSTIRSSTQLLETEPSPPAVIRWRSWPLASNLRWSWTLPAGILCVGAVVAWLGGGWLMGFLAIASLALAVWQYLLPVSYEICSLGVRRHAMGRMRLVPWTAIRAYKLRPTGVLFFQRSDPAAADLLSSLFVPYPTDEDEVVVAVRSYLPNATELP
jgi:hypothetical protein